LQGVDKNRNKALGLFNNSRVAERTAREGPATRSAGVFPKVQPQGFVLLARHNESFVVVRVPLYLTDRHGGLGPTAGRHRQQNQEKSL